MLVDVDVPGSNVNASMEAADYPDRAQRKQHYRGFDITASASRRFGGTLVATTLTGGPDGIARTFGLPSEQRDAAAACDAALRDLRDVIDHLLDAAPKQAPAD